MEAVKGLLALGPGAAAAAALLEFPGHLRPAKAAVLLCAALSLGCHQREAYEVTMARAIAESRRMQIASLEKMVAQAERGELVTTDQIAIGISEGLIMSLLKVSLPPEIVVANRLRVRFESAQTIFRGGQAGILFRARGVSVDMPDASATLELGGALEGGKLAARVKLRHFSIIDSSMGNLAEGVLDGLVRGNLEVIQDSIPAIEVPVQLEQSIRIGGLTEGAVVAKPGILPLTISVSQVIPVNQRLWVLLAAKAGPWQVGSTEKAEAAAK
jgi:hypothetical protein